MTRPRRGEARPARELPARVHPAGIPVRADVTFLLIAGVLLWSFWLRFETVASQATAVAMAVVATVLFVASVLAHELAHALEARRRGLRVEGITLYLFGGATRISSEVARPADQFAMTAIGPWTSIVLGAGFGLVGEAAARGGAGLVAAVAGELGWLNVLLGVFNLLPGAPLDGGRLLDSLVWQTTGDRWRAARVSTRAGQLIGAALAGLGVAAMVLVAGGFLAGFWLVLIGWFLARSATAEREGAAIRARLEGRLVGDVTIPVVTVPASSSVEEAVEACVESRLADAALVHGPDGVVGLLSCSAVDRLTPDERRRVRVEEVMSPLADLPSVQRDAPATELVGMVGDEPVVVLDGDVVDTVVTAERLDAALRWLPRARPPGAVAPPGTTRAPRGGPVGASRGRGRLGQLARAGALAASVGVVLAAAAVVPLPVTELAPGPALDVPSRVQTGGPAHPVSGALLLTSVAVRFPTVFEAIASPFEAHHDLLWQRSVIPSGMDPAEYGQWQRQIFLDSVQLAAAVALERAGYPVRVEGGGAIVVAVETGGAAQGKLLAGDRITGLGSTPVATAADLVAQLSLVSPGTPVVLTVARGDRRLRVTVRPGAPSALGRPALGIVVQDAAAVVRLPFRVRLALGGLGGPSAGLMTALAVYAVTTGADLTNGRIVAGTGTIDADGRVGPVGGIAQKVAGAAREGATVFLVPSSEAPAARRAASGSALRVVAADTFDQAVARLRDAAGAAS